MPILGIIASSKPTAFSPSDLAGLTLWLDASDSATITLNGTAVTQWNDKSANAYNMDQGTASYQPALTTAGQNGLNVISFNSNDFLKNTSLNWGSSSSSLFIVGKEGAGATGYQVLFATGTGATGEWGYGIAADAPTDNNAIGIFDIGQGLARFTSTMTGSNADVLCFTTTGISAGSVTASLFKNGTADASNPLTRGSTTSNTGAQLGAGAAGSEGYLGTICEVIMYNSVLGTTDRNDVEDYLKTKWATV